MTKLPITSCLQLWPPESSKQFLQGMVKLNAKFDADSLLYLLSQFGCNCCTIYMHTQRRLPPSRTRTVKLSLFTYAHSSPLSLAARLLHFAMYNAQFFPHIFEGKIGKYIIRGQYLKYLISVLVFCNYLLHTIFCTIICSKMSAKIPS